MCLEVTSTARAWEVPLTLMPGSVRDQIVPPLRTPIPRPEPWAVTSAMVIRGSVQPSAAGSAGTSSISVWKSLLLVSVDLARSRISQRPYRIGWSCSVARVVPMLRPTPSLLSRWLSSIRPPLCLAARPVPVELSSHHPRSSRVPRLGGLVSDSP